MAFLFGGGSQARQTPAVSGLQLQTSAQGKVVPIVYGQTRIAPNLIWYGNFQSTAAGSSAGKGGLTGGGGGKGGGGGGYNYSTGLELALCEGPVNGVGQIYVDKNVSTASGLGFSVFDGTYPQAPWGYLSATASSTTQSFVIPPSAPYTITVGGFLENAGVTAAVSYVTLVQGYAAPAAGQYALLDGGVYRFNAAQAGAQVNISYYDSGNSIQTYTAVVPATPNGQGAQTGWYLVQVYGGFFTNIGVTITNPPFVVCSVPYAPAPYQYYQSGGVYYFNATNAGQTVNIAFVSTADLASYQALGYNGIAYLASSSYPLGGSPQLPNHNVEVYGRMQATAPAPAGDADCSLVVADYLTNAKYGVGFPGALVGSLTPYQQWCNANGLWISPAYTDQAQASSQLQDVATATNCEFVWSSGLLTLAPYGDTTVRGNGYTWTAPSAPLYALGDGDFMKNTYATGTSTSVNDDPVLLTRTRQADAYNSVQLEYLNRNNQYNTAVAAVQDQASIDAYGLRQAPTAQAHLFCDPNAAQTSAQMQLQRQSVRNTYQFTLDQRYILLDPMDVVSITDTAMGVIDQWVRLLEITENDDGTLSVLAEEFLNGNGAAPLYGFQSNNGYAADYNSDPGPINAPVIFEPTAFYAEALEVIIGVSGGADYGGCDVWVSNDDATYRFAGRVTGSARTGVLTASLPSVALATQGQTIDQADTLTVELQASGAQLLSGAVADAVNLQTLCYVDGEMIAYQSAELSGPETYELTYLVRGAYGTTITAHNAGGLFLRIDDGVLTVPYTQDKIGTTLYIKFLPFNLWGGGEYQLSDVSPYTYTLQGTAYASPLPNVANLRTSYVGNVTQLAWDEVTDFRPVLYEVRVGTTWLGAQILGRVAHPPFTVQGNGTYWLAAYSQPVAGMQVYSQAAQEIVVAGGTIVSNVIASWNEASTGWAGTCSGGAAVIAGNLVRTGGVGNLLAAASLLTITDVLNYGDEGDGIYTIPSGHIINIGRVAPCNVLITWNAYGQNFSDNILPIANVLTLTDFTDYLSSLYVSVYPEINLSQDGVTWAGWQKWSPGAYSAMGFNCRMQLQTSDPDVIAYLSQFVFAVDVPDRDDHYTNVSVASGGTTISFTPDGSSTAVAFNGGPSGASGSANLPAVQVTILNAQQGDTAVISGLSLSQCTIQVLNGGVGMARNVNVLAEGY